MDVVIVYERKQRELENSVLLQIELEKRGLSCEIVQFYEASKFNLFNMKPPKVIVVPHLYNTKSLYRTLARFGHAKHIINMQYEQVLSKKWEDLGAHTPKGEACKGVHICWGQNVADRLTKAGVPDENVKIIAPLHLDLLRPEFLEPRMKQKLSEKFNLNVDVRWALFISSFTYADISPNRLKMNEDAAGTSLADFPTIHTQSRNEILNWLRGVLEKDKQTILIYRPHPDELSLDSVYKLQKEFDNFIVIRDRAVKDWINAADVLYTWYSTSIVEAHFMDKPYSILRPYKLPDSFDSVLLKHGRFIQTQKDFESDYLNPYALKTKTIDDRYMDLYYKVDPLKPSKSLLADFILNLAKAQKKESLIHTIGVYNFKAKTFSTLVVFIYILNSIRRIFMGPTHNGGNLLFQLFAEMDSQIASKNEKLTLKSSLMKVLGEK